MKKRIVVIGGGIAGVSFARTLKERGGDELDITIITKDPFYNAGPSKPLLLTGEQRLERITRGYEEVARSGIRVVFGLVDAVDPANRRVYFKEAPTRGGVERMLEYDYLLVAPGVVLDGGEIEGYREYWYNTGNVYEIGRINTLRERLWTSTRGTVVVYAPPMPYRCAPAPSETSLLIHTVLKNRGVRDNFRIVHVDANDKPQPPVIADVVTGLFEEAGIELITKARIAEIADGHVVLDNGEKLDYTILALLEPNRAPSFIKEAGLGDKWFEVRSPQNLRHVKYDDVLAAGDVAKLPFPKNQEIAFESSLFAANNLIEELGLGETVKVQYAFLGWAYVGNLEGRLESLSVKFGLNFTTKPPKPSKDPQPKPEYTRAKDEWEQAYLKRLFGY